jgi:acetyl-CoA carboxylase biotin carboxyl carrier protein
MDFDEINRILDLVREHELSEFELEREGFKIRIKKGHLVQVSGGFMPAAVPGMPQPLVPAPATSAVSAAPATETGPVAGAAPSAESADEMDLAIVKSPIVGTFFRASEPGAGPFVDVGDVVKKGQVLCIIEAMKLMNEIDSEYDGEIVKIYVDNGRPVQYGERLFAIKAPADV